MDINALIAALQAAKEQGVTEVVAWDQYDYCFGGWAELDATLIVGNTIRLAFNADEAQRSSDY